MAIGKNFGNISILRANAMNDYMGYHCALCYQLAMQAREIKLFREIKKLEDMPFQ